MNYAATRHLVPTSAESGAVSLPWETDSDLSSAGQETWLLSFIDILALLLTLFVLLLAYQDREPVGSGSAAQAVESRSLPKDLSLQILNPANVIAMDWHPALVGDAAGYAMSGEGLLPRKADVVGQTSKTTQAVTNAVAITNRQPITVVGERPADEVPTATLAEPAGPDLPRRQQLDAGRPDGMDTGFRRHDDPAQATEPVGSDAPSKQTAAEQLLATLDQTALGDRVEMTVHPGAVSLDISDNILFAPASAALSSDGVVLLQELAAVLRTLPYQLSVEGHTDNVPIQTARYPSNWELSSARAARVARKLIEQGVAAERVRAIGYGDTRPRSDNDSAAGRAKNRRVTFVLQVEAEPEPAGMTQEMLIN